MPLNPAWIVVAATRTRVPYHQRVAFMTSSIHSETASAVAASKTRNEDASPVSAKRDVADACAAATLAVASRTFARSASVRRSV